MADVAQRTRTLDDALDVQRALARVELQLSADPLSPKRSGSSHRTEGRAVAAPRPRIGQGWRAPNAQPI